MGWDFLITKRKLFIFSWLQIQEGMMAGERGIALGDWSVRMSKCQSVKMKNGGGYLKGKGI